MAALVSLVDLCGVRLIFAKRCRERRSSLNFAETGGVPLDYFLGLNVVTAMNAVPPALKDVMTDFAAAERRARALVAGLDARTLNWQPHANGWSILQCLQHLTLANRLLAASIDRTITESREAGRGCETITPGVVWRFLISLVDPKVRLKGFAPKILQPAVSLNVETTLSEFCDSHVQLRRLAVRCSGHDVNRMRFRHPILRLPMSVGCAFLLLAVHERRHLKQAERVAIAGRRSFGNAPSTFPLA